MIYDLDDISIDSDEDDDTLESLDDDADMTELTIWQDCQEADVVELFLDRPIQIDDSYFPETLRTPEDFASPEPESLK